MSEEENKKQIEHLEALFAMGAISKKEFAREKLKIVLGTGKDD